MSAHKDYLPNGELKEEGNYKDGKKDGIWTYWHENGQKAEEGVFNNDVKTENWIYYQKDGKIRLEEEYQQFRQILDNTDAISKIDKNLRARILEALAKISTAPVTPVGNTINPLLKNKKGMWRYRIGDYRLIYQPNENTKHILLLTFTARANAYE